MMPPWGGGPCRAKTAAVGCSIRMGRGGGGPRTCRGLGREESAD